MFSNPECSDVRLKKGASVVSLDHRGFPYQSSAHNFWRSAQIVRASILGISLTLMNGAVNAQGRAVLLPTCLNEFASARSPSASMIIYDRLQNVLRSLMRLIYNICPL